MNVLVIGSGGREHALVWKLAQSRRVTRIFCAPGNAGIESLARCLPIAPDQIPALKQVVLDERIDLTIVGPEAPLAQGIVDEFRRAKLKIFGPTRAAAQVESSKVFAKNLMARAGIPTAKAMTFEAADAARRYVRDQSFPIVIKADGLAQGKGVIVATRLDDALAAVDSMLEQRVFGAASGRILIEEFLDGEEVTVMAFTDGKTILPMVAAQDHKRVNDGDTGPNTGGMGAYAPAPVATPDFINLVEERVFRPAIEALARLGSPYQGVLYAGLMVVKGQPFVLEFNARLGDPETQVVLPLLKTDLLDVMEAVIEHRLDDVRLQWHGGGAVCVVMTSGGYPGAYDTDRPIDGVGQGHPDVMVFHAGTRRSEHRIVTAGGRVLGVTGMGPDIRTARDRAYQAIGRIHFSGQHFRSDIANRALSAPTS